MNIIFEILSWLAMVVLVIVALPQIILNYKKKSTQGVSWLMFGLLLFGMGTLAVRSWIIGEDVVIRLNYTLGTLIIIVANFQFIYYRYLSKRHSY